MNRRPTPPLTGLMMMKVAFHLSRICKRNSEDPVLPPQQLMRFRKTSPLMEMQMMIFILQPSGTKMTALPRPEDVDVAEAHTEVATVVTVVSIIMGNVEVIEEATKAVTVEVIEEATMAVTVEVIEEATMAVTVEVIEEATMVVTVEDTEVATVEDSVEAIAEATAVASEASEVANEVESVVWICPYLIDSYLTMTRWLPWPWQWRMEGSSRWRAWKRWKRPRTR